MEKRQTSRYTYPALTNTRLRLKCGVCGREARYKVGRIIIRPGGKLTLENLAEYLSYEGYFRCTQCKNGWPWELTEEALMTIMSLMLADPHAQGTDQLISAEPRLVDGSVFYSAAQAEDHLLSLLEKEPENSLIWDRLGNIYLRCGMDAKAQKAFTRSVKADPNNIEPYLSLGDILFHQGKYTEAAEHLNRFVDLAEDNHTLPEEKLRAFMRHVLEQLFEIELRTDGEVKALPSTPPEKLSEPDNVPVVYMTEFDLSDEKEWDRLIDILLGKRKGAAMLRNGPESGVVIRPEGDITPVSRNSPCPCGSGRKFKACCGKSGR